MVGGFGLVYFVKGSPEFFSLVEFVLVPLDMPVGFLFEVHVLL